jgi:hypothetical protein
MKNLIHLTVIVVGALVMLSIINHDWSDNDVVTASNAVYNEAAVDVFSEREICKGVISLVMGRSPEIMTTQARSDDVLVSYVRESDNTKWRAKCTTSVGKAVWGNADGRWRNHSMDPQIKIGLTPNGYLSVSETYADGSERTKTFSADQIAISE